MHPLRAFGQLSPWILSLALIAGAAGACSSSTTSPRDAGGGTGGGGRGGTGGGGSGGGGSAGQDAAADSGGSAGQDAAGDSGGSGGGGSAGQDAAAGGDGASDTASATDLRTPDSAMSMTLTSSALTAGATFMAENTCAGADRSPPLSWTAGPASTMSYAVVLIDVSIGVPHWVIWDLPAATTSLPAALPGAATLTTPVAGKQAHFTQFFGSADALYHGPCPSGALHTYRFEAHAVDAATLPGVTTSTPIVDVYSALLQHSVAHGDLTATSSAARPPADAGGQ